MVRLFLFVVVICSLLATGISAAAESQPWMVRAGVNLYMIASTLEFPKQEIKKQNPGISESNLQIGQKIKLPLRAYAESKAMDEEFGRREQRIRELEGKNSD